MWRCLQREFTILAAILETVQADLLALRDVLAGRTDVDISALLDSAPDTGEAGPQVDAVLADHARLTEGNP
jgi:3-carboxy-cis,cis-muconate cycloisomerase